MSTIDPKALNQLANVVLLIEQAHMDSHKVEEDVQEPSRSEQDNELYVIGSKSVLTEETKRKIRETLGV